MGNGTKKIIAVMCAIALVISSVTVLKKNEVSADTNYAALTYTTVPCSDTEGLSLDYCVVSNNLLGYGNVWYGDGGNTFQIVFSGAVTSENYTITVNGEEPGEGVVSLKGSGLVKINPNVLENNNYYDILITRTDEAQTLNIVLKKGTPAGSGEATSSGQITTTPTTTVPEPTTDAEGYTKVVGTADGTYDIVGNFKLNKSWATRSVWYKGTGAYNDMKVKFVGNNPDPWMSQIGINVSGLISGTQYDYEVVLSSNSDGNLYMQVPGESAVIRVPNEGTTDVAVGENVFSGTFTAGTNPDNGQIMLFPDGMPDGTIFDFMSVTVTEHAESTTPESTTPEITTPEQVTEPFTQAPAAVTECKTSDDLSVVGFQIKVNDTGVKTGFRVIARVPKSGATFTDSDSVQHSDGHFGMIFTLDDNITGLSANNIYNKYHTILDPSGVSEKDWEFEGINNGGRTVGFARTDVAILKNWNPADTTHDYYALTMMNVDSEMLKHTIHVRPYFVDETGNHDIIYGTSSISTSIVRVAYDLYTNDKMTNKEAHDYLFNNILSIGYTEGNYYHLTTPREFGWGNSVYTPATTVAP